ncbi:RNA-binding cell elongation regulator Jag/EloR [Pontibacillus marinus]|uniref:RNA-binding protein KhpB n=1 Tax=Pontibacillus marinus BH030004 = DSM 16465 TaxID=1385511 RepID=A0A0A5G4K6_9BACI|nr:RNA-binding cell elongation regulator Jag/EloR [Pontibacillus marinus]KGX86984.1 protein jag [Pontibacillus marinus BH030004 = DSM 16465]
MRQITATGQTVEDAVQSALEQLDTSRDQTNVEVIDEGKKGFFGLFGSKRAIVKVSIVNQETEEEESQEHIHQDEASEGTEEQVEASEIVEDDKHDTETAIEETKQYLETVANGMGASIHVEVYRKGKEITFDLVGDKIALLIGKRGQTLNALQYLTQLTINGKTNQYVTVIVDAEGYRERRKETLTQLSNRLADKAITTRREVKLEAMPSYERKIIHTALQHHHEISTFSDGNEPYRHVVIKPK